MASTASAGQRDYWKWAFFAVMAACTLLVIFVDERFLVTHHYLTREDFDSDAAWAPYKEKGGSDVYMADFVTGKKWLVTRMAPRLLVSRCAPKIVAAPTTRSTPKALANRSSLTTPFWTPADQATRSSARGSSSD